MPATEDNRPRPERAPLHWHNKASQLRASAAATWYCMSQADQAEVERSLGSPSNLGLGYAYPAYRMLCGMSIEAMLKAILVAKGLDAPASHDLLWLARHAEMQLDATETGLLALLTECIIWHGRYPAPLPKAVHAVAKLGKLTEKHLFTRSVREGGFVIMTPRRPNPLAWDGFDKLWSRFNSEFCARLYS